MYSKRKELEISIEKDNSCEKDNLTLEGLLADHVDIEDDIVTLKIFEEFLSSLSQQDKEILYMFANGMTVDEIRKKFKMFRYQIFDRFDELTTRFKKFINLICNYS